MKPHRIRYWLNNECSAEPEVFDAEVRRVCEHYAQALSLREEGVHLVSTDEKSGIQALERLHPALPVRPGLVSSAKSMSMSATRYPMFDRQLGGGDGQGDQSLHRSDAHQ